MFKLLTILFLVKLFSEETSSPSFEFKKLNEKKPKLKKCKSSNEQISKKSNQSLFEVYIGFTDQFFTGQSYHSPI